MIRGVGFDLCEIERMEQLAEDERFLNRFFTVQEVAFIRSKGKNKAQTLAGIFAAKEALTKALGTGIIFDLREIDVRHSETGQPCYALTGETAEKAGSDRFLLSISHDGGMAGAVCIRESAEREE
jgi:phosphopantetheine--protein transferase-like protein